MDRREVLAALPVFAGLSDRDWEKVADLFSERQYQKDDYIFLEGEAPEALSQADRLQHFLKLIPQVGERMLPSLNIGAIQNVIATLDQFRGQRSREENQSRNYDDLDCHFRPPPFDPVEAVIRLKF